MSHARQQIREALGTALTGLATTGVNVYTNRVYTLAGLNLPALVISVKQERAEQITPTTFQRASSVTIEGYVKGTANIDDTLDTIAVEVETALWGDDVLKGLGKWLRFNGTEIDFTGGESEKPVGVIRLSYDILYVTAGGDPETTL